MNVKTTTTTLGTQDLQFKSPGINLDYTNKGLQFLDQLFPQILQAKPPVVSLRLNQNKMTRLFSQEIPEIQIRSVQALDICENPIENVLYTIKEIQDSMPNVKDLKLNLYDEDHVDFIMKYMPQLQFLNGLPVDRDEEDEEEQDNDENDQVVDDEAVNNDQYDDFATQNTQDSHSDSFVNTKQQDVVVGNHDQLVEDSSEYQFHNASSHVKKLFDFPPPVQSDRLKQQQNQTPVDIKSYRNNQMKENGENNQEIELNPNDLEQIALIYDQIRVLHRKSNPSIDKKLATEFDNHLKTLMLNLSNSLRNEEMLTKAKNAEVLKSKFFLYDVCFEKIISYFQNEEKQQELEILEKIRQGICATFVYMSHQVSIEDPRVNEYLNQQKEIKRLQSQLGLKSDEIMKMSQYIDTVETKLRSLMDEKESLRLQYEEEKNELDQQLQYLESENKKCIEVLIRHSKEGTNSNQTTQRDIKINSNLQSTKDLSFSENYNPQTQQLSQQQHQVFPQKLPFEINQNTQNVNFNQTSQSQAFNESNPVKKSAKLKYLNQAPVIGQTLQQRNLTLKQLVEMINDIYQCKKKHDEKNLEGKQPRETMEQYMYTYLNQRYGLKQLIIEWAGAIINGIKKYSKENNEVCLFGKVLRNEIDEEFRFVQLHVKDTIQVLMRQFIRDRYPQKSENEFNKLIDDITNDKVHFENQYWIKIIERMYDDSDAQLLQGRIRESAREKMKKEIQKQLNKQNASNQYAKQINKRMTREEQIHLLNQLNDNNNVKVYFNDFQQNVLDFQMKEHERFLKVFILYFRKIDKDNDGIINEQEFVKLMNEFGFSNSKQEITYFLQILDPFNTQKITFSEIVQLLSSHETSFDNDDSSNQKCKVPLIEKLSRMYNDNIEA